MTKSLDVFESIVQHLSAKSEYFLPYEKRRMSCEKWVQGEILFVLTELSRLGLVIDFEPEKSYPRRKERCDIYYETPSGPHWVELEVVVTNYLGRSGINITDRVNHVITDTTRVRGMSGDEPAYVFFLAYPFSMDGRESSLWNSHLARILGREEVEDHHVWKIPVGKRFFVYAYLLALRSGRQP